jgi:hypothetical protein
MHIVHIYLSTVTDNSPDTLYSLVSLIELQ